MQEMSSSTDDETGVQVILKNLEHNPRCPHGPTLLFKRPSEPRTFYACSACRDRKDCKFFRWADVDINESKLKIWEEESRKRLPQFNHGTLIERFKQALKLPAHQRMYCHTCNSLVLKDEKNAHLKHDLLVSVSDYQLHHPSELMKPQESSRKEAQYLFASKSTKVIVEILRNAGLSRVLCIGAPRIHEYIRSNFKDSMTSLLLDIDHRFHQFYTEDDFCWFNSFNCHFFETVGKVVFETFLAGGKPNQMAIVTDPPFGGRVEPLSYTFKKIDELHLKFHPKRKGCLAVLWIFPYFMEPQIVGCNPDMKMHDYKVDYDNHPLFQKGPKGRKQGSPVRIFTSLESKYVKFPSKEGYRLCEICVRWVSAENKHCFKCESCTSKDGRTYIHCDRCERCVKPTWRHCAKCNRCCLPKHDCGFAPQVGLCFGCHQPGHKKSDCPQQTTQDQGANRGTPKKRKNSQKSNKQSQKKKRCR